MTTAQGVPSKAFWKDRRVLVTGHTGFKGAWLTWWLRDLGASIMGVSLPELPSSPCLWDQLPQSGVIDVRSDISSAAWQDSVVDFDPEVVLHLAAQSLVPLSYADPMRTHLANVVGTARVLDLLPRLSSLAATLVVTTDKVYDTRQKMPFREDAYFGGADPYSASKACAELVVASWPKGETRVATARAGNVIGGGDWAADRLVPDLLRAWAAGEALQLRRPSAVRPWQHVLEPLRGYLLYVEALVNGRTAATALNFGPSHHQCVPVGEVVAFAAREWVTSGSDEPSWGGRPTTTLEETHLLEIDSSLAASELGWRNVLDWREAITMTLAWHAAHRSGTSAEGAVTRQLNDYIRLLERRAA